MTTFGTRIFWLLFFSLVLISHPAVVFQSAMAGSDTSAVVRDPTDDEIREFGKILSIEDGGYPMHSVKVSFPKRDLEHIFSLNAETADLGGVDLFSLQGKFATIYYLSDVENQLLEMGYQGNSLFDGKAFKSDPQWKNFTGKLEGARAETDGDLPDPIFLTSKAGKTMRFEFFITPEMVEANRRTVTAYFRTRDVDKITYIRPARN